MTPNYGFGAIDWSTIATDPYFMQLQRNNIAFQASQQAAATQAQAQAQAQTVSEPVSPTVPQIDYATTQPESSNTLSTVLYTSGALSALVVGGAAIKHGGIGKGLKAIGRIFSGKAGNAATKTVEKSTTKLTALRNPDGTYTYFVPEKTKTYTGEDITNIANRYNINLRDLRRFKKGSTKLEGGVFEFNGKTIEFKDGKIVSIKEGNIDKTANYIGENVTLSGEDQIFINNVNDILANTDKVGNSWKKIFQEATYRRELGDHAAIIKYEKGKGRSITELTTLEPLNKDDKAVKAWLQNHSKDKEIFMNEGFTKKGVIPEGANVEYAEIPYKGKICRFENGDFKGIYEGNKFRAKGTEDCDSFLLNEESNLTNLYTDFLKGKIPNCVAKVTV